MQKAEFMKTSFFSLIFFLGFCANAYAECVWVETKRGNSYKGELVCGKNNDVNNNKTNKKKVQGFETGNKQKMLSAGSGQNEKQTPENREDLLNEMPGVELIFQKVKGKNSEDTAAKQLGTIEQLIHIIENLSDGRYLQNKLTAKENQLRANYQKARNRVIYPKFNEQETKRSGFNSPRAKWYSLKTHYELDEDYRDEILTTYFSKPFRDKYYTVLQSLEKERENFSAQRDQENLKIQQVEQKEAEDERLKNVKEKQMFVIKTILSVMKKYEIGMGDTQVLQANKKKLFMQEMAAINKKYANNFQKFEKACVNDVIENAGHYEVWFYLPDLQVLSQFEHGFDSTWLYMKNVSIIQTVSETMALNMEKNSCHTISGKITSLDADTYYQNRIEIRMR